MTELVAPFPFMGGKRRIRDMLWERLGRAVPSYIEPFAGSLAVLLGRPGGAGKYETVNDRSGHIANFWRSVRADPEEVARYADYPVIETDLFARHQLLVKESQGLTDKLESDPDYFNPKLAGWWVWGKSCWIGDAWCEHPEWRARPDITSHNGIHRQIPDMSGRRGVHRKMPDIHGSRGIHTASSEGIYQVMEQLAERMRHVRVCAGHWKRVCSSSSMGTNASGIAQGIAPCAIYLDPPYQGFEELYGKGTVSVHDEVLEFCKEHGENPRLRIALSGYEGEYDLPGWEVAQWKAHGGYGNQSKEHDNPNAKKERVWISPHCLKPSTQHTLWG